MRFQTLHYNLLPHYLCNDTALVQQTLFCALIARHESNVYRRWKQRMNTLKTESLKCLWTSAPIGSASLPTAPNMHTCCSRRRPARATVPPPEICSPCRCHMLLPMLLRAVRLHPLSH